MEFRVAVEPTNPLKELNDPNNGNPVSPYTVQPHIRDAGVPDRETLNVDIGSLQYRFPGAATVTLGHAANRLVIRDQENKVIGNIDLIGWAERLRDLAKGRGEDYLKGVLEKIKYRDSPGNGHFAGTPERIPLTEQEIEDSRKGRHLLAELFLSVNSPQPKSAQITAQNESPVLPVPTVSNGLYPGFVSEASDIVKGVRIAQKITEQNYVSQATEIQQNNKSIIEFTLSSLEGPRFVRSDVLVETYLKTNQVQDYLKEFRALGNEVKDDQLEQGIRAALFDEVNKFSFSNPGSVVNQIIATLEKTGNLNEILVNPAANPVPEPRF